MEDFVEMKTICYGTRSVSTTFKCYGTRSVSTTFK